MCSQHSAMLAPHNDVCHLKPFVVQDVGYLIKKKKGTVTQVWLLLFSTGTTYRDSSECLSQGQLAQNFRESTIKCVA